MKIIILTLFPEALSQAFARSIFKRGIEKKLFSIEFINIRYFADPPHYKVDEPPYGGGVGMVLRSDIILKAIQSIDQVEQYCILYTCPKGQTLTQSQATRWSTQKGLIILTC